MSATPGARRVSAPRGYAVEATRSRDEAICALALAGPQDGASPFQDMMWLTTWFDTVGRHARARPLVVSAYHRAGHRLAMVLPLVVLEEDGRKVIEFADLGVTDCNAPLLGPGAPRTAAMARQLWNSVKKALPPADAIRFAKMPADIGGRPNPLALLGSCHPSSLHGNVLTVASYDGFKRERGRPFGKELDRCWRVFQRLGGTEFRRVTDVVSALECLRSIEDQQSERIRGLGLPYNLDLPAISDFYQKLVIDGLAGGYLVMTALLAGGEVVAALLGVRREQVFSVLRISNAGRSWKTSSPGRLVITRTIEHMVTQGCTCFDFSIGDYEFKRRLGCKRTPLYEVNEALSWRGVPLAGKAATKGRLRRYPKLARGLRQFLARETRGAKLTMARE